MRHEGVQPSDTVVALLSAIDEDLVNFTLHLLRNGEGDCDVVQFLVVLETDLLRNVIPCLAKPLEASLAVPGTIYTPMLSTGASSDM